MKALQSPDGFDQRQVAGKALRDLARGLRKRQTVAEQMLWEELRDRRAGGLKFRRQYPVPDTMYVADFCCFGKRLIVELDGEIHRQQRIQDRARQQFLEERGYQVLRISNERVLNDLRNVVAEIVLAARELECRPSPPGPLSRGERGRKQGKRKFESVSREERGRMIPATNGWNIPFLERGNETTETWNS